MSYSIGGTGATKSAALENLKVQMDTVVSTQPAHAVDAKAALDAAGVFVNMLVEDGTKDVQISMSGSVSWRGVAPDIQFYTAGVNISAYLTDRKTS